MENYQKRIVNEKKELDEKIEKLNKFIVSKKYSELDILERSKLDRQRMAMKNYSFCLWERITIFDPYFEHFGLIKQLPNAR